MEINFNAYDFDPTQGGSVCFPKADYKVEIVAAEPKVVKDNPSAGYLEISLKVLEGELRGLIQKDRLNIFHPNETAKRIAQSSLSAYAFAINRPYLQTTEQMIGGRLICTIEPQAENPKYSEVTVIKCMDGTLPTRPQQPGQAPAAQAAPPPPPQAQAPMPPANNYAVASGPSAPPAPPWQTAPPPPPAVGGVPPVPSWASGQQAPPPPPNSAPASGLPPWAKQ